MARAKETYRILCIVTMALCRDELTNIMCNSSGTELNKHDKCSIVFSASTDGRIMHTYILQTTRAHNVMYIKSYKSRRSDQWLPRTDKQISCSNYYLCRERVYSLSCILLQILRSLVSTNKSRVGSRTCVLLCTYRLLFKRRFEFFFFCMYWMHLMQLPFILWYELCEHTSFCYKSVSCTYC